MTAISSKTPLMALKQCRISVLERRQWCHVPDGLSETLWCPVRVVEAWIVLGGGHCSCVAVCFASKAFGSASAADQER